MFLSYARLGIIGVTNLMEVHYVTTVVDHGRGVEPSEKPFVGGFARKNSDEPPPEVFVRQFGQVAQAIVVYPLCP